MVYANHRRGGGSYSRSRAAITTSTAEALKQRQHLVVRTPVIAAVMQQQMQWLPRHAKQPLPADLLFCPTSSLTAIATAVTAAVPVAGTVYDRNHFNYNLDLCCCRAY
jgi:hypothetical protein